MPERHYGLVIASLVAVVAIVGLVLNFSGLTGAITTPAPYYIGNEGRWFEGGKVFLAKCHSDLEGTSAELGATPGEIFPLKECCSKMCSQLCEGQGTDCKKFCQSGCGQGAKEAYGY